MLSKTQSISSSRSLRWPSNPGQQISSKTKGKEATSETAKCHQKWWTAQRLTTWMPVPAYSPQGPRASGDPFTSKTILRASILKTHISQTSISLNQKRVWLWANKLKVKQERIRKKSKHIIRDTLTKRILLFSCYRIRRAHISYQTTFVRCVQTTKKLTIRWFSPKLSTNPSRDRISNF